MSIVSGTAHSERTAVVLLYKCFCSDSAFSVIISALSRTVHRLISTCITLQHMSKNCSNLSSQFITSNFPSILIAWCRFFTCAALGDVDLCFSHIFISKPMMTKGEPHEMHLLYHQHNQHKHVTDGVKVTWISASPQRKTSTAKFRQRQIALNQKLSQILYAKSH